MKNSIKAFRTIYFTWESVESDPRPYKPARPILKPYGVMVAVRVPLNNEYFDNLRDLEDETLANMPVEPVLTTKGMKYCIDQLEKAFETDIDNDDDLDLVDQTTDFKEFVENNKSTNDDDFMEDTNE